MRVEYRCEDGRPFPVVFASEADCALAWRLDREHTPHPLTPMSEELTRLGDVGARRAYEEVGMLRPASFRPGPSANGFAYYCEQGFTDDELSAMFTAGAALLERYRSASGIWHEYCLPLVRSDCAALDAAGTAVPLATLAEWQAHCLHVTMIPAFVGGHGMEQLKATCAQATPRLPDTPSPALVAHELTQGHANQTIQADHALWELGQAGRGSSEVSQAIHDDDPAAALALLRQSGRAPAFFAAFDRVMDQLGRRAEGWDIGFPTWEEQGPGFWNQLRHLARPDAPDPSEAVVQAARRRDVRMAEMEAAFGGDEQELARFRRRVDRVAGYVAVREDRAHWQLVSSGSLRHAVLRRGRSLVESGLLRDAGDILYLLPHEVEDAGASSDLAALASQRRTDHDRWMTAVPPDRVGGPPLEGASASPEPGVPHADAPAGPGDGSSTSVEVAGTGASRGSATGPARVILDLADAERLQPGDVLVCTMTSPPWTPLFTVAAAVVADSGDIGSHVAVAAREYGIPCVVGTSRGTTTIPDGATVTVDGAAGTVAVHP